MITFATEQFYCQHLHMTTFLWHKLAEHCYNKILIFLF